MSKVADEIIKLEREYGDGNHPFELRAGILNMIHAAIRAERESCALLVETDGPHRYYSQHGRNRGLSEMEAHLASVIRSRS